MFEITKKQVEWGGRTLTLESGRIARQADGAVLATYGETTVLAAAVAARQVKPGIDFFPLTVNYIEKTYSAGKIPGGFFKREGRPSEKETLVSRLIDRPIRPLFMPGFKNETQVTCTVLSHDMESDPDIVAMIAASAALTISGIPFLGPIAAARIGFINGEYVLNPQVDEIPSSALDLVVAGTSEGVLMVESQAQELDEDVMLGAVNFGHRQFQTVIDAIIGFAESCAKEPWDVTLPDNAELKDKVAALAQAQFEEAYGIRAKQSRQKRLDEVRTNTLAKLVESVGEDGFDGTAAGDALKSLEKKIVRGRILAGEERIDGRGPADIRPIDVQVGVLPRAHGSALFTRGETQALVVTTLGTGEDEQIIDALEGSYRETFMLHYNFPPYSVGEVGRVGFTGRREVGHGKLAWRALRPLMPPRETFPYTVRVVSEITESNGSSSMASVCGGSLSLMDAGVPLARPVAGIAMGLIKEGDSYAVLSDIMGDEDHLGDMDFKVAGTENGITSLQMDIKITSITSEIMEKALAQAKSGRFHILGEMAKGLAATRPELNVHAPRIEIFTINKDKIREVIGSGGSVIREIVETTGAKIDIEDDGTVRVASADKKSIDAAINWIQGIVAEPEVGRIYHGKVVKVVDFGAFVNFIGNKDGLVHISEMADRRVGKVTDVVNEGDKVYVKVLGIDDRGKVRLSMRVVDQETGKELVKEEKSD